MEAQRPEVNLGSVSDLANYTASIRDVLRTPINVPRLPRFYNDPFAFTNRPYMPGFEKAKKEYEEKVKEIEEEVKEIKMMERAKVPKKLKAAQDGIELLASSQYPLLRELLEQESGTNSSEEVRKYLGVNLLLASRNISPRQIKEKLPRLIEELESELRAKKTIECNEAIYEEENGYATCPRRIGTRHKKEIPDEEKRKKAYENLQKLESFYHLPELKKLVDKYKQPPKIPSIPDLLIFTALGALGVLVFKGCDYLC